MYNIIYETNRPVQVRCMIQDAWGWCTGMTQRDGMGFEVGGGFSIGNTFTHADLISMYGKNHYNIVK